jgi:glutaredoxin
VSHWLRSILFVLAATIGLAAGGQPQAAGGEARVLEVFVRETCWYCAEAKRYLPEFAAERPGLTIVYRDLDEDPGALEDLFRHAADAGRGAAVPMFHIDGRSLFGFISPEQTGPALAALVDGEAGAADDPVIRSQLFGKLSVGAMGLPAFTLAMGVLDGLNPCVMWALLFLLSMLVHLHDRTRIALIAGTYVLATAAMHYALMAAWLNFFLLAGLSIALQRTLGGVALVMGLINVKDFFAPGSRVSLSMPGSARPGLGARIRGILTAESLAAALVAVTVLAVAVNVAELLCTAAFPALYTAALSQQGLVPPAPYAYLALYIVGYALPAAVLVASAVAALSSPRLTALAGRWLKLTSGIVMIALAVALVVRPRWLW